MAAMAEIRQFRTSRHYRRRRVERGSFELVAERAGRPTPQRRKLSRST